MMGGVNCSLPTAFELPSYYFFFLIFAVAALHPVSLLSLRQSMLTLPSSVSFNQLHWGWATQSGLIVLQTGAWIGLVGWWRLQWNPLRWVSEREREKKQGKGLGRVLQQGSHGFSCCRLHNSIIYLLNCLVRLSVASWHESMWYRGVLTWSGISSPIPQSLS
jgi:hypothetical protein